MASVAHEQLASRVEEAGLSRRELLSTWNWEFANILALRGSKIVTNFH